MTRKITTLILALLLCVSLAVSVSAAGETAVLYDEADLLSAAEEAQLNAKLLEVSQTYNAHIIVATIPSMDGGDIDQYVEHVYDSMNFGYGQNHDGVFLLVCMDPREYRILSNGFAADAISMGAIDGIGDAIVSDLSYGYYADAFHIFADECAYYLGSYIYGQPFDLGSTMAVSVVIGLILGLIVALILKGQLKSVRRQNAAHVYVKPGSMEVTIHRDLFLYRNVTRTRKANNNSSGSRSGGSRSVGGGSF